MSITNENETLDKENTMITNQTPKAGIQINKESKVYVEY